MFITCPSHVCHVQTTSHVCILHAGAIEVTYRASEAEGFSAMADEDFLSQDFTVTFASGEESKTVDIPVTDVRRGCGSSLSVNVSLLCQNTCKAFELRITELCTIV